jgi:hypothetical protein
MPHESPDQPVSLPPWLLILGSGAIAFHLLAITLGALAAPSGPWPTPMGPNTLEPPQFASMANRLVGPIYLQPLRMTHTYHFTSNRPGAPGAYFEVVLKDASGKRIKTLKIPDANANFWVRHRQSLLAQGLNDDVPVPPPQGEKVAAPHKKLPKVAIWEPVGDKPGDMRHFKIAKVDEHLIPRNRFVLRPSEWSLVLAKSYARYLCRTYSADRAEIIRHMQDPIPPSIFFMDLPPGALDDMISNFGEFSK